MTDSIEVSYNDLEQVQIKIGEDGIIMSRQEAEQLFVDMGYVLQDMDVVKQDQAIAEAVAATTKGLRI